ncbi:DUF6538 domain-containing protein [Mesorhizobium sp. ASY16-5R]|uniref:DUF6538 domain-containing protein n=1 Tax=Mesorhizobium sp. ASY16-5R TaxID=3445772 RepID=UPI003FA00793
MPVSAYLSVSRHKVYYFRHPLPKAVSPTASAIRISLRTREPRQALYLAQRLRYVAIALTKNDCRITLDEFRNRLRAHFSRMLGDQKQSISGHRPYILAGALDRTPRNDNPSWKVQHNALMLSTNSITMLSRPG